MILDRLGLWPARLVWLLMPLFLGRGLTQGLDRNASGPSLVVEILLWIAWFVVLVALLAPSPRSLTAVRIAGPGAVGVALLATLSTEWTAAALLAIGFACLFTAVVFLPTFGDHMINGSAYGSERRMALRPTALVLLGPAQLAWLLIFIGLIAAPVLILRERYVLAAIAALLGAGAVWAGTRVLHQLSRRWIVFVPAGFVIHDPLQIVDSVLFRRNEVQALGPAFADEESLRAPAQATSAMTSTAANTAAGVQPEGWRTDLSGGAIGLALEVELKKPTPITVRQRGQIANIETANIVFSPTLPGAMLSEARIRGMKIGGAAGPAVIDGAASIDGAALTDDSGRTEDTGQTEDS